MKLSIGHLTFTVRRFTPEERNDAGNPCGMIWKRRGIIAIRDGMSPEEEASTLLHEIIHGLWYAAVLPEEITEEDACRRLEGPLLAFLADNPQAVSMLIAARGGVPLPINEGTP